VLENVLKTVGYHIHGAFSKANEAQLQTLWSYVIDKYKNSHDKESFRFIIFDILEKNVNFFPELLDLIQSGKDLFLLRNTLISSEHVAGLLQALPQLQENQKNALMDLIVDVYNAEVYKFMLTDAIVGIVQAHPEFILKMLTIPEFLGDVDDWGPQIKDAVSKDVEVSSKLPTDIKNKIGIS
jgi:hypothetical protein